MRQAEAEAISPPLLAPGVVPLQVCRAEEIHSRWLPLRDERERKQEPGKGPAARSRLVSMKEAVVVKGLGA